MLNKEECLKSLEKVENPSDVDELIDNREILEQLIKEHFDSKVVDISRDKLIYIYENLDSLSNSKVRELLKEVIEKGCEDN